MSSTVANIARSILDAMPSKSFTPGTRTEIAQGYATLAVAEAIGALRGETAPTPDRHPKVERAVRDAADGRTIGDLIDTLGFDGFPIGVVGPSIFVLLTEGRVHIDEDQRVHRA